MNRSAYFFSQQTMTGSSARTWDSVKTACRRVGKGSKEIKEGHDLGDRVTSIPVAVRGPRMLHYEEPLLMDAGRLNQESPCYLVGGTSGSRN